MSYPARAEGLGKYDKGMNPSFHLPVIGNIVVPTGFFRAAVTQSAGVVEYTDYLSAEE